MRRFEKIEVEEALNAFKSSVHEFGDYLREQLLIGNVHAYKFGELYVLFEYWGETLMVQCVEGKGLDVEFMERLQRLCKANDFKYLQFVTPHKGIERMAKVLNPVRVEYRYICKMGD